MVEHYVQSCWQVWPPAGNEVAAGRRDSLVSPLHQEHEQEYNCERKARYVRLVSWLFFVMDLLGGFIMFWVPWLHNGFSVLLIGKALLALHALFARNPFQVSASSSGHAKRFLWICKCADFHRNTYLHEEVQKEHIDEVAKVLHEVKVLSESHMIRMDTLEAKLDKLISLAPVSDSVSGFLIAEAKDK
ncbi:unnamed protein product [Polarella glacialis]|uniref:Uncharacterized protein n=1 Tax=Polarella glacialis TaxID=89957 RepID=A0A813JB53_POLGL|nr:unnamed protein product [Polarella glacialis]